MSDYDRDVEEMDDSGKGRGRGGPGRFGPRRNKFCSFCVDQVVRVSYKDSELLRRFLTDRGKIRPRRQTGICAKHQRSLARAVKQARHLALLPFQTDGGRNEN